MPREVWKSSSLLQWKIRPWTPKTVTFHRSARRPLVSATMELLTIVISPAARSLFTHINNLFIVVYRIQKYSSYTFSVFAALHITNTAFLPLITQSTTIASRYLLLTRPYYQSFPAEPMIVILPLMAHVASGVALRMHRRKSALERAGAETQADRRSVPWPTVSWISATGFAAVPLVLSHAALLRGLPLKVEGGSSGIGLDFVGHGVAIAPKIAVAAYGALVAVAGSHILWGWAKWLGWSTPDVGNGTSGNETRLKRKRRWWTVMILDALVVTTWMAGGLGIVARNGKVGGWVGKVYDDLYRRVPGLGNWVY